MLVICDIETNALVDPSRLWLIVCREVESGKVHIFTEPDKNPEEFLSFSKKVSGWIGHNFIDFDVRHILRLVPGVSIDPRTIIDTLVVSRLLNYNLEGGHSLAAWGNRLSSQKQEFSDFSALTDQMIEYCIQDVHVNFLLFKYFSPYIYNKQWSYALRLEHDTALACSLLTENGFAFDIASARELHKSILSSISLLNEEIKTSFKPKPKAIREITPKETSKGNISLVDFRWAHPEILSQVQAGCPFTRIEWEEFNPGSSKQRVEVLNAAGWSPYEKTKGHIAAEREGDEERLTHFRVYGWKCSEANLATLPETAPEAARKLVQWLLLDSRRSTLEEWFNAYDERSERIHGSFLHIGAWTGRMSHARPNMANIPSVPEPPKGREPSIIEKLNLSINPKMRALWRVPVGKRLVGVDAEGIQLRILAHYINDPVFTEALVNGRKEDETDAHSMNKKALGSVCKNRDSAKTFIYAWLLGAGIPRVAEILECDYSLAKDARESFLTFYPGLETLKKVKIPKDARRGYFEGLDKRLVICNNEHLMLAGYLQNGEAIIMKAARRLWAERLSKEKIPYRLVNFVHDEWQTETEDDDDISEYVAQTQIQAIVDVGQELQLKCPLAGSRTIGYNWKDTH